jgi:sulfite reductase alpha subunit-like flavoprotein
MDATSVHLTVKILREPMNGAPHRTKEGVCTTQLEVKRPGDHVAVFVRASAFRLPASAAAPVLMVGPGTGIAPFRAFLQEFAVAARRGKPRTGHTRLYFGCRKRAADYLYEPLLAEAVAAKHLSSLRVAFSREQAKKVYVQDLLKADGADVWRLLAQDGGHLYVCGGTAMGRDVLAAVTEMGVKHGGLSPDASADFIKKLGATGRLVQELWS